MFDSIRNLVSARLAGKSTKKSGLLGKMGKVKAAKRLRSKRGRGSLFSGAAVHGKRAKFGLGTLLGIGAIAAGVMGAKRAITQKR